MSDIRARTVKNFCQTYGIGKSLAYELMASGTLAAVKAGARTLILEDSAQAWFNSLPPTHVLPCVPTPDAITDLGGMRRKRVEPKDKKIQ